MSKTVITGTSSQYVFSQGRKLEPLGYKPKTLVKNNGIWCLKMAR